MFTSRSRIASSDGAGIVTLLTHILPLTPGSRIVSSCCFDIVDGGELPNISRTMLTIKAVRRSHFEAVGDSESRWNKAVFRIKGVFKTRNFRTANGEFIAEPNDANKR